MAITEGLFDVDPDGLCQQLKRRGTHWVAFVIAELYQNAVDEDGVNEVRIDFTWANRKATIRVEDDAPNGFADLSHAYTLFAPSTKKDDPTKRGIFCIGEKLVIAVCRGGARITTTTGCVEFDVTKRTRRKRRKRTERGSVFEGTIPMLRAEYDAAVAYVPTLIPPKDIDVYFNNEILERREAKERMVAMRLPTVVADEEGNLKRTARNTSVEIYDVLGGEVGTIYEMGIPVMVTEDKYHYNVLQRVPVNWERNSVPPSFLKAVRVLALNAMHADLEAGDVHEDWVQQVYDHPDTQKGPFVKVLELKEGAEIDEMVTRSLHDPESVRRSQAEGRKVLEGARLSKGAWGKVREWELIQPSHEVTPSHMSLDWVTAPPYPENSTTDDMRRVLAYSERVGEALLGLFVRAKLVNHSNGGYVASYAPGGILTFNVARLGKAWFNSPTPGEKINSLLIHEFAHERCPDHLDSKYHDACCDLGAKLTQLALERPALFEIEETVEP